ncbi:MAG TPA: HDOD domain-containing protein, partial [Tepidisphaeraceae bacterium]|nr:HDOD domain-containing protein [Tepidisphaeraceae bacterium]
MKPTSPQPTPPWVDARREHVERLVGGLRLLPTSAAVPVALLDVKRRDAGAAELSAAIAADPGLAARVIAVANAPAFGGGTAVSRVSEAVDRIGAHHALPLALGLSFAGLFHPLAMG